MDEKLPQEFVNVEAMWEENSTTLEGVVRMRWCTEMIAEYGSVSFIGYRLVFFHNENRRGFYNGNEWTDDLRYIRNPHFSVLLWPKEKRTYEWAYASPKYYGITEPGKWAYQIELAFQFKDEDEVRIAKSNRATIDILDHLDEEYITIDEIENAIIQELGHPDPIIMKRDVEMGSEGVIDLIVHRKSSLWVFEIKNKVSEETISSLRKAVKWVESNYRRGRETVQGTIIITGKALPRNKSASYNDIVFYRFLKNEQKQPTLFRL